MKDKIVNKKLTPFKKYGFTIRTLRTSLKSSKGTTYAYEFSIYKGRTWVGIENYQADNISDAKKKLMRDLRKQKYKIGSKKYHISLYNSKKNLLSNKQLFDKFGGRNTDPEEQMGMDDYRTGNPEEEYIEILESEGSFKGLDSKSQQYVEDAIRNYWESYLDKVGYWEFKR